MRKIVSWVGICLLVLFVTAATAEAKVSAQEAAKLGKELTPLGATRAGDRAKLATSGKRWLSPR